MIKPDNDDFASVSLLSEQFCSHSPPAAESLLCSYTFSADLT